MTIIINKNTGEVLGGAIVNVTLNENEIAINEVLTENYVKPYFNFETRTFYEEATQEEINEANKAIVPFEVQLWRIRTILKIMQLETQIESAIDAMPEPSKTAATYIWKFGTTVERASQTVMLLQSALQLTDEQVDDLFIQAEAILL